MAFREYVKLLEVSKYPEKQEPLVFDLISQDTLFLAQNLYINCFTPLINDFQGYADTLTCF